MCNNNQSGVCAGFWWLALRRRCMKWAESFLLFILCNKPEIWREVKHVFKLNHGIMTKKECREIHPYQTHIMQWHNIISLTRWTSLQVMYTTCHTHTVIERANQFLSWTLTHRNGVYISMHFAGTKPFGSTGTCGPPRGLTHAGVTHHS